MLQTHYQVQFIESILLDSLGHEAELKDFQFLYCGNFNLAARVETQDGRFFIKWNQGSHEGMFESEAKSMELIRETNTIHVPKVYGYGKKPDGSYLMLDFVAEATRKPDYWQNLGQKVALLHQFTNENFGLHFNNYVGAIPQINDYMADGLQFFIERRLQPNVNRALADNKISHKIYDHFQEIYQKLPNILPNEKPSLLHGDLWSGNLMVGSNGYASVVDPSAYYGLREADIAFTTLFGGFHPEFYQAYHEAMPLAEGFKERIPLYNLYPLMVHVNLFGGGYLEAVERVLERYG